MKSDVRGLNAAVRSFTIHKDIVNFFRAGHPDLQAELKDVSGPLLPNGKGKTFSTRTFRQVWETELAGEELYPIKTAGLVPHGLCKNAHSRLRDVGLSKEQIQAITGRSPKMVEYYSKGADQRVQAPAGACRKGDIEGKRRQKSFTNGWNS